VLGVKVLAAAFIMALLLSVLVGTMHFGAAHASIDVNGIPKPSIPEYSVKFVDNSYDEPPTYEIDPYTGENVTHPSYHVKLINLEMTIKNQPFSPYYDADSGWNISFYYNIRIKGYYSEDWTELYRPSDGYPTQSDSEYTVISLGTLGENGLSLVTNAKMIDVHSGGQVDFQVEAMIGYVSRVYDPNATGIDIYPWWFTGETSGWSNTQTITISESQTPTPSPATSPTPTSSPETTPSPLPTPYEIPIIGVAFIVIVFLTGLGLLIYLVKRK